MINAAIADRPEIIVSTLDTPKQPWVSSPYSLISWWDMERFSAADFYKLTRALQGMRNAIEQDIKEQAAGRWDDATRMEIQTLLMEVEKSCEALDLKVSVKSAQFASLLGFKEDVDHVRFVVAVEHLEQDIQWEMEERHFFYVPPVHANFYGQQELFGLEVAAKFPSASFDIRESGNCLAVGRSTACVFHLMRVLEIGLTALGKQFSVSLAHTNWGPAIDQIESKIRGMNQDPAWKALSDWKDQQEFFSQAASYLGVTKDAWRNYTAHARGKYLPEEAELMLQNVRAFMERISQRMSE